MKNNTEKHITITIDDGLNAIVVHARPGENLLDVIRRSGKPLSAPCGGQGTCGKCAVHMNDEHEVLACTFEVQEDCHVRLPEQRHFSILDHGRHEKCVEWDAGLRVTLSGDARIVSYLDQELAREKKQTANNKLYGLAVDVGTTTVVVYLANLNTYEIEDAAAFINPQTAYGGDVISRINFCIENDNGLSTLKSALVDRINEAIAGMFQRHDIEAGSVYKMTFVGNTVMQHILYGADPRSIAFAPYTPVFTEEKVLAASDLGLLIHPNAVVKLLPSVAGYVGADIVAGLASTDILDRDGFTLYIDIGTNGEIVLGNSDKIWCCATAAGPAFEGANISCGVGGVNGAISEYQEDEFTTIGNSKPIGICGSGLIDIVAGLLDKGLIDMMGYMEQDFIIAPKEMCAVNHDIKLTPKDVREVQLAKSAIYGGIETLMKIAGIGYDQIERLYLAGGFGNYIRVQSAIRIGLLPQELEDRIVPIGNAAGTGARFALKSLAFEKEIARVLDETEYIELSMRQDFNEAYVAAMMFA